MGKNEQTYKQENQNQANRKRKKEKHQVQEQWNFSLSLSSGVTPLASSPGIGIYEEVLEWSHQVTGL
jgi:uncharacterized membrane protein